MAGVKPQCSPSRQSTGLLLLLGGLPHAPLPAPGFTASRAQASLPVKWENLIYPPATCPGAPGAHGAEPGLGRAASGAERLQPVFPEPGGPFGLRCDFVSMISEKSRNNGL